MKNTFIIPEINVEKFEKQMNKLIKLSTKLGAGNVQYELLYKEFVTTNEGEENEVTNLFYTYEISGETPTLKGYILVAILEKQLELNLVFHMDKEHTLPQGLETNTNHCEHCNHKRARKHLFILKEEATGRYIQVGKSCVKDFTGAHHSPELIANYYEFISDIQALEEIDENENFHYQSALHYANVIDSIAISAYYTDKCGYVKTQFGSEKNPSTKTLTIKALTNGAIKKEVKKGNYYEVAKEVAKWILEQESNSEYMLNLKTLTKEGFVSTSKLGFIASAYSAFLKSKSTQIKKELKEIVISEHVGEIGKRMDFVLTFKRSISFDSLYGTTNIYFFNDDKGNQLIWKTGNDVSMDEGEKVSMKATVKEHGEYKDVRQTILTRCAKIKAV